MRLASFALNTIPILALAASGCDVVDKHLNDPGMGAVVSMDNHRSDDYTGPSLIYINCLNQI
ncbi:MAG: hypothetical protein O3C63_06320 [Cyanobacteria bacterium]|nr:hypothetical protein [Cyanobacteriota bacterium]MDA1020264.1 hypothetical protein [Cyanobacteriota bacterium]